MDIGKHKRVIFVEPLRLPTEPESPIEEPIEEPEPATPTKKPTPA